MFDGVDHPIFPLRTHCVSPETSKDDTGFKQAGHRKAATIGASHFGRTTNARALQPTLPS